MKPERDPSQTDVGTVSTGETKTVSVEVPVRDITERRPAIHHGEEQRGMSLSDGPAIAFTQNAVRLYDDSFDEFVELSNVELIKLLASIYEIGGN